MSETVCEKNDTNSKRLKTNLTFWSPLNDNFALPDKKSKCTWAKNCNKETTPHSTHEWYMFYYFK